MKLFLSLDMKKRLDLLMVELGLCSSRSKARELIDRSAVELCLRGRWQVCTDPAHLLIINAEDVTDKIRLKDTSWIRYVSRAGLKLEGALQHTGLGLENLQILDVGQSTGGFTDVALQRKARLIVGFDVGRDQLHASLKARENVLWFEGIHAKEAHNFGPLQKYKGHMDLIVGDVSFISTRLFFSALVSFLNPQGRLLFLIKPQFELGPGALDKNGIVKDKKNYILVEKNTRDALEDLSLTVIDYFPSVIEGQDGNQEFFVYAQKKK